MREVPCPICGECFAERWGTPGAPEDGARELYCSEECRERAERAQAQESARASRWKAPESFPWPDPDPFAE